MAASPGLAQDAFYSCAYMATVGVKGLNRRVLRLEPRDCCDV